MSPSLIFHTLLKTDPLTITKVWLFLFWIFWQELSKSKIYLYLLWKHKNCIWGFVNTQSNLNFLKLENRVRKQRLQDHTLHLSKVYIYQLIINLFTQHLILLYIMKLMLKWDSLFHIDNNRHCISYSLWNRKHCSYICWTYNLKR